MLASAAFVDAPRLSALLAFIVEQAICGHGGEIKESVIAVEVFGRAPDFDPRTDSVVRVQARNLRAKLRSYYEQDGRDEPMRFDLPSGSYVPVFQTATPAAAADDAPTAAAPPARAAVWTRRRAALSILILLLACALAVIVVQRRFSPAAGPRSLAVLPFLNFTGNPGSDYFVDGFVDELTTSLAQAKGLHVVARSSAFQFRGKSPDVRAAGRQLGVAALLEGSVLAAGKSVRLTVQLVDAKDGFHLWSHTYEGTAQDVFSIRDEIASAVPAALGLAVAAGTNTPAERPDLEAYDLYLQGQYFKERITLEDLGRSIGFFEQSIQRDPGFAAAHAALADACATLAYHQLSPDRTLIAKAKAEASRALQLNGSLAEAHALGAWIGFFYDWNWADGERGLRHALELGPNSARTHDWLSQELAATGRFDEAVAEARKALLLDPLNYRVSSNLSVIYYCAHRYRDAIHQAHLALDINPHFFAAHVFLGASLQELGRLSEARAALQAAVSEYPGDADARAHLAVVEAALGRAGAIPEAIAALYPLPGASYELAYLHLAAGDRPGALGLLEKAFAEHGSDMAWLDVDPAFDSLHGDPRFSALRKRMGWPK